MTASGAGAGSPSGPGTPPSGSDPRRLLGHVISGRYRIEELIGEGGMGAVYRAQHTHLSKRLAVKVLHPEMLNLTEAVERFEREAIAGAHIEHPNVAAATDFGKLEDGSHFLVLEFLEGEDLRTIIGRGRLSPERAIKIARQIALALRAAHQIGIVHRDLKPENIMLVRKERDVDVVKVLDFGIAKVPVNDLASSRSPSAVALTKLGMVYGTPEYMAPEQALGEEIDGRADLYALGVMFYEMLCGHRPFEADSRVALLGQVATRSPPSLGERVPGVSVPPPIETIVMRLLEKTPADRYANADELVDALDAVMFDLEYTGAASRGVQIEPAPMSPPAGTQSFTTSGLGAADRTSDRPRVTSVHALPQAISRLPRPALLVVAGVAAIGVIVIGAISVRNNDTLARLESQQAVSRDGGAPAPEEASGATADDRATLEELTNARTQGLTALGALAQKYPNDPAVLRALLFGHAKDPAGYPAALGVAKRLLAISPVIAEDDDLQRFLAAAAGGAPEVAAPAFEIMATDMGSHGPDLLYQLMTTSPRMKDRAQRLLGEPSVIERSTPALRVAIELNLASSCKAKKPLLPRAAEYGDERAAAILRPLITTKGRGCGFFGLGSCGAPCASISKDIDAALREIDARTGKPAQSQQPPSQPPQ